MTQKNLKFLPLDKTIPFSDEESVLEVALKNGIDIPHSCGGMGSCTTCRVVVESRNVSLPARTELEQDIADMRSFTDEERLSCQLPPLDGLVLRIPEIFEDDESFT